MDIRSFPPGTIEGLLDRGDYVAGSSAVAVRPPTREAFRMMDAFAKEAVEAGLELQDAYEEFVEHVALLNEGLDEDEDRDLILAAPRFRYFRASFEFASAAAHVRLH